MKGFALKLGLLLFGIALGLLAIDLTLRFFPLTPEGSSFESLEDLRSGILSDASSSAVNSARKESVPFKDIIAPDPNEKIIFDLRPNLNVRFQRAEVKTNRFGMRGPEVTVRKPPGTFRIALLGDSFAFGWGVEDSESFARRLEKNLNQRAPERRKVEVLNFGVPGYSTFQEVEKFRVKGLCFLPDAVIVYFVQNDFGLPFFIRDVTGNSNHNSGLFTANQFSMLLRRNDARAQEAQAQQRGWDPHTAMQNLIALSSEHGFKIYLAINPRDTWREDLNKLWAGRRNTSVTLIELRDDLLDMIKRRNIPEKDLTLAFDPHPSPLRHSILGDLMTPYFLDALTQ